MIISSKKVVFSFFLLCNILICFLLKEYGLMMRLKKVCLLLLSVFFFIGCATQNRLNSWMKEDGKLKILSTTAQVGDLAAEIGGERVDALVLIQGDLDPHSYEIVKGDAEKFLRAQVIFHNGLGLEHGASLSALLRDSPRAVAVGDRIREKNPGAILKKGQSLDPHLWMDISLWAQAIDPIVEGLSAADPEGASYYRARGEALAAKMREAHVRLKERLHRIPAQKRYLVTSHDAFQYFTRSYLAEPNEELWSERFEAPEGLAPDGQLNPLDIQRIIDYLKAKKIAVIFPESNVSRDAIKKIASSGKELGLDIRICSEPLYGDAMGGLSYLEMMERNAEVIQRNLEN